MVSPERVDGPPPDGSGEPEFILEEGVSTGANRSFHAQQRSCFEEVCPDEGESIIALDAPAHTAVYDRMLQLLHGTFNPPPGIRFTPISTWTAEDRKDFTLLFEAHDSDGRSLMLQPGSTPGQSKWVTAADNSRFALVAHFLSGEDTSLLALPPSPFMTPEYLEGQISAFMQGRANILEHQLHEFLHLHGYDSSLLEPTAERSAGCGLSLDVAYRSVGQEDGPIELVIGLSADAEFTPLESTLLFARNKRNVPATSSPYQSAQKFVERARAKGGWGQELELSPPSQLSGSALAGVASELLDQLQEGLSADQTNNADLALHYLVYDPTRSDDARLVFSLYDGTRERYLVPGVDMEQGILSKEFVGIVWELSDTSHACRASDRIETVPSTTLEMACTALCAKGADSTTLTDAGYIVSQKALASWLTDAESRPWESILGQHVRCALIFDLANEGIIEDDDEVELESFELTISIVPEPPAPLSERFIVSALVKSEYGQHVVHAPYFPTDNFLDLSSMHVAARFLDDSAFNRENSAADEDD
ncbi:MAG: hypothetical protein K1X79_13905 [Oligoflexia bacterium]|nr:hypothetical protein [Oligoflexia bacterium]